MRQSQTEISLVQTTEELEIAYQIRRDVFLANSDDTEEIEFDGNDLCSSHLLAYWKGKPAATMRLRVVSCADGGTIMWERLAILKSVSKENPWMFRSLLSSARKYTEMMGIETIIGIVENKKLMRFWQLYGFEPTDEEPLMLGGHQYIPIALSIAPKGQAGRPKLKNALMALPTVFAETKLSA